jgi:hypothetical protein
MMAYYKGRNSREYREYIIKYFVKCCGKESIIYSLIIMGAKLADFFLLLLVFEGPCG